ncbi:MAG: hypothetical protein J6W84_05860, partial [Bacteroidales bacterium]|nr:hypothetical protein [Bacteroidales bacterium]
MKKVLSFAAVIISFLTVLQAQVPPQKMGYQTVVRNSNNELVVNQLVGVKISILEDNINGGAVFVETHSVMTNANALATLQIGTGTPQLVATLADVDWEHHDYYIKAEIDPAGGSNYSVLGTQQLITVPYAFYAGKSAYADTSDYNNLINRPVGNNTGDILYWDAGDNSWHVIPVGSAGQVLTLNPNGIPQWYSTVFNQSAPPTIVTDTIMDITGYTMTVKCSIVNSGSTGIIASGVCWSSSNPSPSIGNNYTTDGASVGSFLSHVSGLSSSTVYYVCAYATNSVGTSYGNVITITTPTHCGTVTDIDGNTYNTVYIGRQCWMKENLRTTTYADGINITKAKNTCQGADVSPNNDNTNPSSCYYYPNNDSSNVYERGLLYTWPAVMKGAGSSGSNPSGILGVCPFGWHVPSSREWCELENVLNVGIDVNCSNTGWRGTMAKVMSQPKYWIENSGNS